MRTEELHGNERMPQLKLLVDRELDDGRVVVVNCSREEAPIGSVFTTLFLLNVRMENEEFHHEQGGPSIRVELKLESVEWFRRFITAIPGGHNAAVLLTGSGLSDLRAHLNAQAPGRQVILETD